VSDELRADGVSKLRDGKLEKLLPMPNDGIDVNMLGVDSMEVSGFVNSDTSDESPNGGESVALTMLPVFKSTVISKLE
jgi:hypothetical protein